MAAAHLEKPKHDWAVDDEAGGAEQRPSRPGYPAALNETENVEFPGETGAIPLGYGFSGPLADIEVPERAVVGGDGGDASQYVQWAAAVAEGAVETLC